MHGIKLTHVKGLEADRITDIAYTLPQLSAIGLIVACCSKHSIF